MAKTTRPKSSNQTDAAATDEASDMSAPVIERFEAVVAEEPRRPEEEPEVLDAVILAEEDLEKSAERVADVSGRPFEAPKSLDMEQAASTSAQSSADNKGGSGFFGMVAGGLLAAAAGYGVATYFPLSAPAPQDSAALDSLKAEVSAQADALRKADETSSKVADLEARLAAVEAGDQAPAQAVDVEPLQSAIAALETRIAALEARPTPTGGGTVDDAALAEIESMKAEIEALKGQGETAAATVAAAAAEAEARLAEAEAQAAALKAAAEETARKAVQSAAVGRIKAALETGAPYASALSDLEGVEIPAVLASLAETGVPTIRALSEAFPDAAREALDASRRATMGDSLTDRLSSLLETATGARSLAPREGSDPDAVLSRAEAAVLGGDVETALAEIKTLPPEGQTPLADWVAMAQTRLDAVSALANLSAAVSG